MVPIHGVPLLEIWLKQLMESPQIEQVYINCHYYAEQVREYVIRSKWRERITLIYEPVLLGTAGTLRANLDAIFGTHDSALVIHADNLSCFDLQDFLNCHEKRSSEIHMTMMTFCCDTPEQCGILEVNSNGVVVGFHEKVRNPPGNNANAAVYLVDRVICQYLKSLTQNHVDLSTEVIPFFIGQIQAYANHIYHRDIGTPESLELAHHEYPLCQG